MVLLLLTLNKYMLSEKKIKYINEIDKIIEQA